MASANCLASGVDHLWPPSVELHLAPETRQWIALTLYALRESCLAVRDRLLLIILHRNDEYRKCYRSAIRENFDAWGDAIWTEPRVVTETFL